MSRPQVADGADGIRICRVATNIFGTQLLTQKKGWSSRFVVGLTNRDHKTYEVTKCGTGLWAYRDTL